MRTAAEYTSYRFADLGTKRDPCNFYLFSIQIRQLLQLLKSTLLLVAEKTRVAELNKSETCA